MIENQKQLLKRTYCSKRFTDTIQQRYTKISEKIVEVLNPTASLPHLNSSTAYVYKTLYSTHAQIFAHDVFALFASNIVERVVFFCCFLRTFQRFETAANHFQCVLPENKRATRFSTDKIIQLFCFDTCPLRDRITWCTEFSLSHHVRVKKIKSLELQKN